MEFEGLSFCIFLEKVLQVMTTIEVKDRKLTQKVLTLIKFFLEQSDPP